MKNLPLFGLKIIIASMLLELKSTGSTIPMLEHSLMSLRIIVEFKLHYFWYSMIFYTCEDISIHNTEDKFSPKLVWYNLPFAINHKGSDVLTGGIMARCSLEAKTLQNFNFKLCRDLPSIYVVGHP